MIIDFRARMMPGMDEVLKSRIDTIRRIMAARAAGVELMVAAPLYQPEEGSVADFLERRAQSEKILDSLVNSDQPDLVIAATVKYSDCLLETAGLEQLRFGRNCLLLDVKGVTWSETMEAVLRRLTGELGLTVVAANTGELSEEQLDRLAQLGGKLLLSLSELRHKRQSNALLPRIDSGFAVALSGDWDSELPYHYLTRVERHMDAAFDVLMSSAANLLEV